MNESTHEPIDTCHCPGGVSFRLGTIASALTALFFASLLVQALRMITEGIKQAGRAASTAAGSVDWQAVGIVTAGVFIGLTVLAALFLRFFSLRDQQEKKEPFARIRVLRRWLMLWDLHKQFKRKPELLCYSAQEMIELMEAEHEPGEVVKDPKMLEDYAKAFETVKGWNLVKN